MSKRWALSEETAAQLRRVRFSLMELMLACMATFAVGYLLGLFSTVTIDITR